MPLRAASAVEMAMTSGMARPRAWGQAITSTVTVRSIAWSGSPRASHTASGDEAGAGGEVEQQRGGPVGQGLRRGNGSVWACSTSRRIPARAVCSPTAVDPDPEGRVGDHRAGHHPVAVAAWAPGGTRR